MRYDSFSEVSETVTFCGFLHFTETFGVHCFSLIFSMVGVTVSEILHVFNLNTLLGMLQREKNARKAKICVTSRYHSTNVYFRVRSPRK